jgi:hypothetical protein
MPNEIEKAQATIEYEHDGPITPFVLISRTVDYAYLKGFKASNGSVTDGMCDAIANALMDSLRGFGYLSEKAIEDENEDRIAMNTSD